eukprot:EG_transcript_8224
MGSKPVRERHRLVYGGGGPASPSWQTTLPPAQWRPHQEAAMARLSEPRHGLAASVQHHFYHRQKAQDLQQMELLFGPLTWLYASIIISKDEVEREMAGTSHRPGASTGSLPLPSSSSGCFKKAARSVDRLMRQHGIEAMEDKPRRQQLQVVGRYGLLFDIVTTRRVIMTGEPHMVATELYRYMAVRYPAVKFTFVGITDNGSKRVARDIFCKDKLPGATEGYEKYIQKCPMDAIDDNHLYVVFPEDDARIADIVRLGLLHMHEEEELRRNLYATPKYEPPPLPDFVQRALQAERMREVRVPAVRCAACQLPVGGEAPERVGSGSPRSRLEPLVQPPVLPAPEDSPWSPASGQAASAYSSSMSGRPHGTGPLQGRDRSAGRRPSRARRAAGSLRKGPPGDAPPPEPVDLETAAHLKGFEERLAEINQQFKRRLKASRVEEPPVPPPALDVEEQRQHQLLAALITHLRPELIEKRADLYKPLLNLP